MTRLTVRQLRRLEDELRAQRGALLSAARDELSHADEHSFMAIAGEVPDFGDQATAASLTDLDNEIARRHAETIRDIDAALARIAARRFGRCATCGADIAFERLSAAPTAARCALCQRQRERTYAVGATPSI